MVLPLNFLRRQPKPVIGAVAVLLTLAVGYLDYATGPHVSLSEFYLLPIAIATWWVGTRFGLVIAILSVALWIESSFDAPNVNLASWNLLSWSAAQLVSFTVVVAILTRLRTLQSDLERRVRQRAADLTNEVRTRERLQRELLGISEREQRRIGQDLHDGLCQHLAGTALTCQALQEELSEKHRPEAKAAQRVVDLIEEGLALSRRSAKGLHPIELNGEGLMLELEDYAATTSRLFGVRCRFECDSPVLLRDHGVGEHLYRIAQEAVRNAIRHGQAGEIAISLNTLDDGLELRVADDGKGIADTDLVGNQGMGLRIMPYRARLMGAGFSVKRGDRGGTVVICKLPIGVETGASKHEFAIA